MMNMIYLRKYFIFSLLILVCFCQEKKKSDSLLDLLVKSSALTLSSTSSRCQISSANNSQYFSVPSVPEGGTVSVNRITTQTGKLSVDVYYPNEPSLSLPILILFQGGNVHSSFYSRYAARIASGGYVVYVANRCDVFIVQYFLYPPISLANQISTLATQQKNDVLSPLFGRLDDSKIGFLGHSLGGVVGLFAMNNICESPFCDSEYKFLSTVKAGVFYGSGLGASFDKNKFFKDARGKGIPTGYIQGLNDGANKPSSGEASYANSISTKVYMTVTGANHYGITDSNNPFGANAESQSSAITQSEAISKIAESSLLFMDAYLKENPIALAKIQTLSPGISGVSLISE